MDEMKQEEFLNMLNEKAEQAINSFNKQEPKKFKHEYIGTCEDGFIQVKITCHNRWLNEEVSIILNNEQFGTIPYPSGHLSRLIVSNNDEETCILYGFFAGNTREHDECLYIDGIVDTLESGATDEFFGGYG